MINYNELSKSEKELSNLGKDYIKKSTELIKVIDYALSTFTTSYFMIYNTINLLKSETDYLYSHNLSDNKEVKIISSSLEQEIINLYRTTKEIKVKLGSIKEPGMRFHNKAMRAHSEQYIRLHEAVNSLIENLMEESVRPLFDLTKKFDEISYIKHTPKSWFDHFYLDIEQKLKEAMNLIKNVIKNNKLVNTHIDKYRESLRKELKIKDILKEIYRIKPVALMRPGQRIWVKNIKRGDIFIKPLFKQNSTLFKESFTPFTDEDLQTLKEQKIISLYMHNNIQNSLKPWDYDIVVVDDDEMITDLVSDELNRLQFNVRTFNQPEEALISIYEKRPHLILLDIEMPKINGINFLKQLYSDKYGLINENIPVIMVTSQKDISWIRKSVRIGANDYLTKPFTIDDLITKITSHL
jgi:CheY-like chemotaxis protein